MMASPWSPLFGLISVFSAGTQSVTFSNLATAKPGYSPENGTRINTLWRIKSGAKLLKLQPPQNISRCSWSSSGNTCDRRGARLTWLKDFCSAFWLKPARWLLLCLSHWDKVDSNTSDFLKSPNLNAPHAAPNESALKQCLPEKPKLASSRYPVRCCQDLRASSGRSQPLVWIMVCSGDALKAHHHGEPSSCTSRWAMSGACWHRGSLIFYSTFSSFWFGPMLWWTNHVLADRTRLVITFLGFKHSCFRWPNETRFINITNNAGLLPLSCRVLIRRFLNRGPQEAPSALLLRLILLGLIKGGYLFDCSSISLLRG